MPAVGAPSVGSWAQRAHSEGGPDAPVGGRPGGTGPAMVSLDNAASAGCVGITYRPALLAGMVRVDLDGVEWIVLLASSRAGSAGLGSAGPGVRLSGCFLGKTAFNMPSGSLVPYCASVSVPMPPGLAMFLFSLSGAVGGQRTIWPAAEATPPDRRRIPANGSEA